MPTSLSGIMTIAGENEQGEKLEISGTIYEADGKSPYPNIIIYAFHTDNTGHYSKNGTEQAFKNGMDVCMAGAKQTAKDITKFKPSDLPATLTTQCLHIFTL